MKISAINMRLMLPLLVCEALVVAVAGIIDYLLLRWLVAGFLPLLMVPVVLFLVDEAFIVGRTGMLIHYHTRHTQEGLREFLVGNGAKQFEALLPYYRHVMARTVALSGWRWLLVMLLTAFALLFVSFFGGLQLSAAVWLTVVLWVSCLVCSLLMLLGSTFLYDRLNR